MKKTCTAVTLLAGVISGYSQGSVSLNDYKGVQVLNVQPTAPENSTAYTVTYGGYTSGTEYYGNGGNSELPQPGLTGWAQNSALGTGYSVQLLAAPGGGIPVADLSPTGPVISTWYSAAGGNPNSGDNGFWNTSSTAPVDPNDGLVTVAIAAWYNNGGTVNTLAAAQAGGESWGISQTENLPIPPLPPSAVSFLGSGIIESFSLGANSVPEPSSLALGLLGGAALFFRLPQTNHGK